MYFLILLFQLINARFFQSTIPSTEAFRSQETVTYTLVFKDALLSPDGFAQMGITINDVFPGPTLRVHQGAFLRVKVRNLLSRGLAIHFHGIHQRGTVASDGVPGVTQYEIRPNGTYTYVMEVTHQSGTFMYHAHTGLDQNWAMGALIVEDPPDVRALEPYKFNYEETLILSQCWHTPISEIAAGILGDPFEDVPDTVSILINGRSHGKWNASASAEMLNASAHAHIPNTESEGFTIITVKPGKRYRFRIISLAVDSMLSWAVENHTNLVVIEMDGILTEPVTTDHLEVNTAQRYSVLISMDQPVGNYWIRTEMLPGPGPSNGRAILHYEGAPDPGTMRKELFDGLTEEADLGTWILDKLYPAQVPGESALYPVPSSVDKEFVIKSHQVNVGGRTQFTINGQLFKEFYPPLLHQIRHGLDYRTLDQGQHIYEILEGESIQIVFVNGMSDDGECEQHPWHMHGHAFHVVGQGPDDYDPVMAKGHIEDNVQKNRNQFRDVVTLFPAQEHESNVSGTACGWVAIRFVAQNPGLWIVHCHLTAHMLMGKLFVLYEHSQNDPNFNEIT